MSLPTGTRVAVTQHYRVSRNQKIHVATFAATVTAEMNAAGVYKVNQDGSPVDTYIFTAAGCGMPADTITAL